jgi:hypothetical protein
LVTLFHQLLDVVVFHVPPPSVVGVPLPAEFQVSMLA